MSACTPFKVGLDMCEYLQVYVYRFLAAKRDFLHHFGHLKETLVMILLLLFLAFVCRLVMVNNPLRLGVVSKLTFL